MTTYKQKYYMKWPILLLLLMSCFLSSSALYGETTAQLDPKGFYISKQAFSQDYSLESLFSQVTESFQIEAWQVEEAALHLELSTTQLSDENLSTLTASINGISFYSEVIPPTEGLRRQLALNIPVEHLVTGTNVLTLEGYIRTAEGLPCVDDVAPSNWINLFSDSYIALKYRPEATVKTISDFYTAFSSLTALDYNQSAVTVNQGASPEELTAASRALAALSSQMKKDYDKLDFIPITSDKDLADKQYILYVSSYDAMQESYKLLLSEAQSQTAQKGALLALVKTLQGQDVLLLIGNDFQALAQGSRLLGNPGLVSQLNYTSRELSLATQVATQITSVNEYYTLTETGVTVEGPFRQSANFYINLPSNRSLASGSELFLNLRYSKNLNFSRSLVSVYLNDVPIGSKKLSEGLAEGDTLTLPIPIDAKVTGSFNLKIAFDLEIENLWCTLRQNEMPWGYISPTSQLKLNTQDVPYMLFEYFPSPFVKDNQFNEVVVIMPDTSSKEDYSALAHVMKTLGRYAANNQGGLEVRTVSNLGDLTGKNVITIGSFANNSFTASLNDQLYFKFAPEGTHILTNEKIVIDPNYGAKLGTVQLLKGEDNNSWQSNLIISGITSESMATASNYLGSEVGLWSLYGDGYIAANSDLWTYRFKADNAKTPSFSSTVSQQPDLLLYAIFVGMIIVLMILSIILLILKYRKEAKSKHERK